MSDAFDALVAGGDAPAVLDGERVVPRRALLAIAERLAGRVAASPEGSRVALAFGRDRLACAAALLGAWLEGRGALAPATAAAELVAPATFAPGTGLLLHDTGVGRGVFAPDLVDAASAAPRGRAPDPPAEDALLALELEPCPVAGGTERPALPHAGGATLRGFSRAELAALVAQLAEELAGEHAVVCAAAPTSLPGLLLGAIAPLAAGVPFARSAPADPADLAETLRAAGGAVLVAPPSVLRGLLALPPVPVARVVACWRAPDVALAERLAAHLDAPVEALFVPERDAAAPAEAALRALPGVVDVAVLALPSGPLAVVEAPGVDAAALAAAAPGARVARVERLARDANGLLPAPTALRRLALDARGEALPRGFEIVADRATDPRARAVRVRVTRDSAWFPSHFPGHPVLAGAVQLDALVLPLVRELAPGARVTGFDALKFLAPVGPGDTLRVEVRLEDGDPPRAARFAVLEGDATRSSGRVALAAGEAGS